MYRCKTAVSQHTLYSFNIALGMSKIDALIGGSGFGKGECIARDL